MYKPNIIEGENLSIAWGKTLKECRESSGLMICPCIVSFDASSAPENIEIKNIRNYLDDFLSSESSKGFVQSPIETVAGTIFPQSIWKMSNNDPETLYNKYKKMWPQIKKCRANRRGVYFQRLISFGEEETNQLEKIISTWSVGVHRLSALQAGIFDPNKDHIVGTRQLGFPCLQQIVFQPLGTNGQNGLTVIAFYANQLLVDKAYGNYLGLYRLGKFMAGQMGIELKKVICIAASLKLDYSKSHTKELETNVIQEIENATQSL